MQQHDWSSTSPKEPMLHLSLSPCTGYQLQLASSSRHWCLHIEQPQAQHPPTSTHYYESTSPPEVWDLLVSDASWYHHREAQNHSPEHSRSPLRAGGMIFPPPSGMLYPCQPSSNNWKLISFNSTWLHHKKKPLSLYLFLLLLACTYVYIYTFSRRFYPKRLALHSSYSFYILSALAFPGIWTHDLGIASSMLHYLSYRKDKYLVFIWTMPETWCYEHFFCLFASLRWIASCILQL